LLHNDGGGGSGVIGKRTAKSGMKPKDYSKVVHERVCFIVMFAVRNCFIMVKRLLYNRKGHEDNQK
jgi:hypothetical protein